jgi:hypothetical protein
VAGDLICEQQDAVYLAAAMVACRLVDGSETSINSRVVELANALGSDIMAEMEDHLLSAEALDDLRQGLAKYAMLCGCLAGLSVEIIQTGARSGFSVSNLDEFLSSPYVMPELDIESDLESL